MVVIIAPKTRCSIKYMMNGQSNNFLVKKNYNWYYNFGFLGLNILYKHMNFPQQ